ncbi:MAG: hypothetical protein K6C07_09495, partial [Bacteroidales bacterium]|nr:hypothetical protein [Bacteroidales bacterium]
MKKELFRFLIVGIICVFTLSGCQDPKPTPENDDFSVDVIVMNEGNWHSNNASLTAYDLTRKKAVT